MSKEKRIIITKDICKAINDVMPTKKIILVPESIYDQVNELYNGLQLVEVRKIPEYLGLGSNTVYIIDEDKFMIPPTSFLYWKENKKWLLNV